MSRKKEFLKIKEAAQYLGVTEQSLRNWDKLGKLVPQRHPMNNYRVYEIKMLEKILKQLEGSE